MGKVFNALEKFQKEEKKKGVSVKRPPVPNTLDPEYSEILDEQLDTAANVSGHHEATHAGGPIQSHGTGQTVAPEGPPGKPPVAPTGYQSVLPGNMMIDPNLIVLLAPQSFEAEQFKILRTNLLFPSTGRPPRSILVTSAHPGEGKSFVSANLAISIAQNISEYVLLVDCDIRKPTIHRQFGLGDLPGLSEYLSTDAPLSSLLAKTMVDKLTVLPAGRPAHNPAELLSSPKMQKLLQEVTERYDDRYIIVDSPPPSLTAETHAIASYVDGIILVIKFCETPRKDVRELIDKVGRDKVLGTIINRFALNQPGYGKYKSYSRLYSSPAVL